MVMPSNRERSSRAPSSEDASLFALSETFTVKSVVIVSKPQSNARSWIAFRHNPLLGLVRFFTSAAHGTMWLAFNRGTIDNPVMQQRPP